MATKNFTNVRLQTKRDTSTNWESNNPVLLNGEEILVDTNAGEVRKKIGDGTKKYKELPFSDENIRTLIGNKVEKVTGKDLSTNDYTTEEKTKLSGIAAGAEVNQNAFSKVKVGNNVVVSDTKTDMFELVQGDNITISAADDKITITANLTDVLARISAIEEKIKTAIYFEDYTPASSTTE